MARRLFDAHFHVVDPAHPLVENNGFLPDPFTVADYRARVRDLNVCGGAVVSGSFQAFDQGYLLDELSLLDDSFAGVTQLPADTPDERIAELDRSAPSQTTTSRSSSGSRSRWAASRRPTTCFGTTPPAGTCARGSRS